MHQIYSHVCTHHFIAFYTIGRSMCHKLHLQTSLKVKENNLSIQSIYNVCRNSLVATTEVIAAPGCR